MIVYKATNKENGKVYIGYTSKTLEERKLEHLAKSKSKGDKHYFYLFKEAIRKYGFFCFEWEIICECNSIDECYEKEKHFIKEMNTISPDGYNLTEGGNGGVQSKETRNKISKSVKKYWSENKESNNLINASSEQRSEWAKKSWEVKKNNGYKSPSGFKRDKSSKTKMSNTKNKKNALNWANIITGEKISLSCTKMSEYTDLSIGTFSHIKHGRMEKTKCGWKLE